MKILDFENVSLIYQTYENEIKALENINFSVEDGEFVAIVGPSGCGKTTILSLIAGLFPATSGQILIDNKPISDINNNIGYMFQNDHLFEWRTIWQNIMLGPELQGKAKDKDIIFALKKMIDKYGLKDFINNYPKQLSGGMRQRVALLRTLALNPKILLLDEPFSALDFQTRLELCNYVHSIIKKEKKTAILVTHDISEAISMADRIIILTKRPATIKRIIDVKLSKSATPLERRESEQFRYLFEEILKDLQNEKNKT